MKMVFCVNKNRVIGRYEMTKDNERIMKNGFRTNIQETLEQDWSMSVKPKRYQAVITEANFQSF